MSALADEADRERRAKVLGETERVNALIALQRVLHQAGRDVPLYRIQRWGRGMQGQAYLWAIDFLAGHEDIPPPTWVSGGE